MFELCASILAADFAHLARDVQAADAAGADAFHIDIMDGHFVPAISFGTGMVRTMRGLTRKPLDVHLMVETPLDFVEELAALGVERVSVHYEIPGGPGPALQAICAAGMQPGLVLNPETPVEAAKPFLPQIRQLLLMTVHPGRGGQPYLPGQPAGTGSPPAHSHSGGWGHHPVHHCGSPCGRCREFCFGQCGLWRPCSPECAAAAPGGHRLPAGSALRALLIHPFFW